MQVCLRRTNFISLNSIKWMTLLKVHGNASGSNGFTTDRKIITSFHYCLLKKIDMHFIEVIWSFAPEGNYLLFFFLNMPIHILNYLWISRVLDLRAFLAPIPVEIAAPWESCACKPAPSEVSLLKSKTFSHPSIAFVGQTLVPILHNFKHLSLDIYFPIPFSWKKKGGMYLKKKQLLLNGLKCFTYSAFRNHTVNAFSLVARSLLNVVYFWYICCWKQNFIF